MRDDSDKYDQAQSNVRKLGQIVLTLMPIREEHNSTDGLCRCALPWQSAWAFVPGTTRPFSTGDWEPGPQWARSGSRPGILLSALAKRPSLTRPVRTGYCATASRATAISGYGPACCALRQVAGDDGAIVEALAALPPLRTHYLGLLVQRKQA